MTINALLAALATLVASCLISLMAVFLGAFGPQLDVLLAVQTVAIVPALGAVIVALIGFAKIHRWQGVTAALLRTIPVWLVFAFLAVNTLVAMGELSFIAIAWAAGRTTPWREHAPLVCALSASLAFCVVYAWRLARRDTSNRRP